MRALTPIVVVALGFLVLGAVVSRWVVVVAAGAWWPVYFLGLERGLWGSGVGDGWEYGLAAATALALAGAAAGVAVRSALRRSGSGRHGERDQLG